MFNRRVIYITGTRADFGLMRSTLIRINKSSKLSLSLIVTGMHLSHKYGYTAQEIKSSGIEIIEQVPVNLEPETGKTMSLALSVMIAEFTKIFNKANPDIVIVLGDRGEMLAGALSCLHLGIPVAHIHGGERSGTIDESIRHAISKLSHIHLTSTLESKSRLISLGEVPANIHVTGAPGIEDIDELATFSRSELISKFSLIKDKPICLLVFHPVVQESSSAGIQVKIILEALSRKSELQIIGILPNSDSGSESIRQQMNVLKYPKLKTFTNLSRNEFLSFMREVDFMIGNSSSGIIESGSFGTPVINIGSRQKMRQRNTNVVDVKLDSDAIYEKINLALKDGKYSIKNIYGDGKTGKRIQQILEITPLNKELLNKVLTY
ncbi:UDP-N-acetylglucosamine 2-epimerase [Gammaproteobacteria bacterium]|nr:UDP-N-acetylglucosamine 2-epimerase [Gammaproteobacteria bacterium]MDA9101847.1 UDP-N-acetylglucosamine 2-epimerase [Gammaproteobacteria bacterium]